jgi:hypothetical protein
VGRKQQETAPAPRVVAPVTVAGLERRREEHAAAQKQLLAQAAVIHREAAAEVRRWPRDPETAAPVVPRSLDAWCSYTIAARLTPVSAAVILIVDALRRGPEAVAAAIASVSDLGVPREYEDVAKMLGSLPRDGLVEAERAVPGAVAAWRRKTQAIMAAAQAAA